MKRLHRFLATTHKRNMRLAHVLLLHLMQPEIRAGVLDGKPDRLFIFVKDVVAQWLEERGVESCAFFQRRDGEGDVCYGHLDLLLFLLLLLS